MLISNSKQSARLNSQENALYNVRLCQSVPSMSLSARFQTDLQSIEQPVEPLVIGQHRSTLNSIEISRQISSKQSCRTYMPNINHPSQKRKNKFISLKTNSCMIFVPGLKIEDSKQECNSTTNSKNELKTLQLKNPIKHFSFQFRNRDKWFPLQKIN